MQFIQFMQILQFIQVIRFMSFIKYMQIMPLCNSYNDLTERALWRVWIRCRKVEGTVRFLTYLLSLGVGVSVLTRGNIDDNRLKLCNCKAGQCEEVDCEKEMQFEVNCGGEEGSPKTADIEYLGEEEME